MGGSLKLEKKPHYDKPDCCKSEFYSSGYWLQLFICLSKPRGYHMYKYLANMFLFWKPEDKARPRLAAAFCKSFTAQLDIIFYTYSKLMRTEWLSGLFVSLSCSLGYWVFWWLIDVLHNVFVYFFFFFPFISVNTQWFYCSKRTALLVLIPAVAMIWYNQKNHLVILNGSSCHFSLWNNKTIS